MQDRFDEFSGLIQSLPATLTDAHILPFRLHTDPKLEIYFAPFEWVNDRARVTIVGITPGRASMERALATSRAALLGGSTSVEASRRGKQMGSFSNMRETLTYRMDEIGIQHALGIGSAAALFGESADLLHCTSCVRYPVFAWSAKKQKWGNYGGYSPRTPAAHPVLREYVTGPLAAEMKRLANCLVIPLGRSVSEALQTAGVPENRCLYGFPHASNGKGAKERAADFETMKGQLRVKVEKWATAVQADPVL